MPDKGGKLQATCVMGLAGTGLDRTAVGRFVACMHATRPLRDRSLQRAEEVGVEVPPPPLSTGGIAVIARRDRGGEGEAVESIITRTLLASGVETTVYDLRSRTRAEHCRPTPVRLS